VVSVVSGVRCGEKVAATLDRFATVVPDETCGARLLDLAGLWAEIIAVIFSVAYLLTRCLMVSARLEGIQGPDRASLTPARQADG